MYLDVIRKACKKLVEVKKVLTTDFILRGETTNIYSVGQTTFSFEYPGDIQGKGENGTLNFTVEDVNFSVPVDIPLYAYSGVYDSFGYDAGQWIIYRKFTRTIYNGSEDWEMVEPNFFRITKPVNSVYLNYDTQYDLVRCPYAENTSYATLSGTVNKIAIGTQYLGVTGAFDTLEDFKSFLNNNPMKVIYAIDEGYAYEVLPDNVQEYLNSYVK